MKRQIIIKILTGFIIILVAFEGFLGISTLKALYNRTQQLSDVRIPLLIIADRLSEMSAEYRLMQYDYIAASDGMERVTYYTEELKKIETIIQDAFNWYEEAYILSEEKLVLEEIKSVWERYVQQSTAILELSKAQEQKDESLLVFTQEGNAVYMQYKQFIQELIVINEEVRYQETIQIKEMYKASMHMITAIFIIIFLFILLVLFLKYFIPKAKKLPDKTVY